MLFSQEGQDVYLEVFHKELEAFKQRVKDYTDKCRGHLSNTEQQNVGTNCILDPKEATVPSVSALKFVPASLVPQCIYHLQK